MSVQHPINVLIWAGGLGTRLRPLTFEDLGDQIVACYPKGVLPLAGYPLLCRVLESVFEGVDLCGWTVKQLLISTTTDAQSRVLSAVDRLRYHPEPPPILIVGPNPGDRFLRSLSETYPTLSCHDDTLVTAEGVATMIQAFWRMNRTVIAVSPDPSDGSVLFHANRHAFVSITADSPLYHAPLRIYSPAILEVAEDIVQYIEERRAEEFREFMLNDRLLERGLAMPVPIHAMLNVNSPSDYLRALRRVLGYDAYVAPDSICHPAASLITTAVEESCRIGRISAKKVIIFPHVAVADGCVLQRCIIGRGTRVLPRTRIVGSKTSPIVIGNFKTIERSPS